MPSDLKSAILEKLGEIDARTRKMAQGTGVGHLPAHNLRDLSAALREEVERHQPWTALPACTFCDAGVWPCPSLVSVAEKIGVKSE